MILPQNLKKPVLIISSVIIGVGIIFLALNGDTLTGDKTDVNDKWKDSLSVIPSLDEEGRLAVQRGIRTAENISSDENLSVTDLFSRKIFTSYVSVMNSMATGTTITDDQAEGIANELIKNLAPASTTIYTTKDLNASADNSPAAFITYSKLLGTILNTFATTKAQEIPIIYDAFTTRDEKKVALLAPIIAQYKKLESDLLAMKTPTKLASIHLRLVQDYATMRSALTTMHDSFNDPIAVLTAFPQYKNGLEATLMVAAEYKTALSAK